MSGNAREVRADVIPRLQAAARHVSDCQDATGLAMKQRDALIVEAVDDGVPQRTVKAAAGVSLPRIQQILAEQSIGAAAERLHETVADNFR